MALTDDPRFSSAPPKPKSTGSFLYRREVRQAIYQILVVAGIVLLGYLVVSNTAENLRQRNIASGFGFLKSVAGFDIAQTLVEYFNTSSYGRAFIVGLWNTILVAIIGIVLATIVGFVAGIARLSNNWLVAKIATLYVETIRNVPLLLQLLLWYFGVLKSLPSPRQSLNAGDAVFLNVRGLYLPHTNLLEGISVLFVILGVAAVFWLGSIAGQPKKDWSTRIAIAVFGIFLGVVLRAYSAELRSWNWLAGNGLVFLVLGFAILASLAVARWASRRQLATGQRFPVGWASLALVTILPGIAFSFLGQKLQIDYPALKGFNFEGGDVIQPELVAITIGLVVYTGAFIAEIVRAGILGVPKGQWEAARAMGLSNGQLLRLVVIPQAMRIIIPPLTSNYLNLTKNSSLGVAIAYADLVNVAGTILNQTGQAVEVILMIMGVYLTLSLVTSFFMNWFNAKMALVER
jgi:general L-amino acid transport system permease protein